MHYLGFLIAGVFSLKVSAQVPPIGKLVRNYFNSRSVQSLRSTWETHKKSIEDALQMAIALLRFNKKDVYLRKNKEQLGVSYVFKDRQVQVVFKDFELISMPRCGIPVVQFSPASNVLSIQTKLSMAMIYGNYSLLRNRNDILFQTKITDPVKTSAFQLVHVNETGKLAIWIKDCKLSGFIITMLNRDSFKLGYDYFKFSYCKYVLEMRNVNSKKTVFEKYNLDSEDDAGLSLFELMLRPLLTEELIPEIQAAVFKYVDAATIFGPMYTKYRDKQKRLFQATAKSINELIRNLNTITFKKNEGVIDMEDYTLLWDEDKKHVIQQENVVQLTEMVLFGLNSMYSVHSGGPIKTYKVMIADEIQFSSLQVRGLLYITSGRSRSYNDSEQPFFFTTENIDLVVDIQLKDYHWNTPSIAVKGLRRMAFALSTIKPVFAEDLVGGYLLNEVPKLVHAYLTTILPEALDLNKI